MLGMVLCTRALAMDFTLTPSLNLGSRTTNNVLFSITRTQTALQFDSGGQVAVTAEGSRYRGNLTPSFNLRRFAVGDNLDGEEYGISSEHRWQVAESLTATLDAGYAQDSTLSAALTDAGRRNTVGNRNTLNLAPSLIYSYDALTQLSASFSHSEITTDTLPSEGLVDYTYKVASLGGSRQLREDIQMFATGFANWFDVPSQQSSTVSYGAQTGLTWQWDPQLRLELAGGYLASNIDYLTFTPVLVLNPFPQIILLEQPRQITTGGPIASLAVTRTFEQWRAAFRYSRQVSPTLRGAQSIEDSMEMRLDHDWSRDVALSLGCQYALVSAQADVLQTAVNDLNRAQLNVTASVSFQASRQLSLRGEYRYTTQENDFSQAVANGHYLALTANYQFERIFIGLW